VESFALPSNKFNRLYLPIFRAGEWGRGLNFGTGGGEISTVKAALHYGEVWQRVQPGEGRVTDIVSRETIPALTFLVRCIIMFCVR
jgi:hypothetical protein